MTSPVKKVLILCHPHLVFGGSETIIGHWASKIILEIFKEDGWKGKVKFDTADIKPGGTIEADVFEPKFSQDRLGQYDLVFAPDSSGLWYSLQPNMPNELLQIAMNLSDMVKPGGFIFFSKFLCSTLKTPFTFEGIEFVSVVDAIHYSLSSTGFDSKVYNPGIGVVTAILARRDS